MAAMQTLIAWEYISSYILNAIFVLRAHAQERLLYRLKLEIIFLLPIRWSHEFFKKNYFCVYMSFLASAILK